MDVSKFLNPATQFFRSNNSKINEDDEKNLDLELELDLELGLDKNILNKITLPPDTNTITNTDTNAGIVLSRSKSIKQVMCIPSIVS